MTLEQIICFIATKYKDNPAQVSFFTKAGKEVPENAVEKVHTKAGTQLYTVTAT
ncbi:hypothetical protein HYW46_02670 [Candidatus Daviesbacteria bacterium]|nr:hypothetical protein [Candidatus Daviesbacteria bacterium]